MYESAPRVERVDDHLGVNRAGDLDAAALSAGGTGAIFQSPARMSAVAARKSGPLAGVEALGALAAQRQQLLPARVEVALEHGDELERGRSGWSRIRAGSGR
jgi:hypothetical protein